MAYSMLTDAEETWRNYLDLMYHEVPLSALTDRTLRVVSSYMDMDIRSLDNDRPANYAGLASVIRLNFGIVESLRGQPLPTARVIREWQRGMFAKVNPTIGNLVRVFVRLNRLDVASDCSNIITGDAENYLIRQNELPITPYNPGLTDWYDIITAEDTPGRRTYYDVFIICSESEHDADSVKEIAQILENHPYNLKVHIPDRDGLFGVPKHETEARVMEERCKHVIVIFSPEYDNCKNCLFQTDVAIYLSSKDRSRRIVPILINGYPQCDVPAIVQIRTVCDFSGQPDDAKWRQLAQSVCRFNIV